MWFGPSLRLGLRGLLGCSYSSRPSPQALTEPFDILRSVDIPVRDVPAPWAVVNANGEVFRNLAATRTTDLTRAGRVHFHDFTSSFFRFDVKPVKEDPPTGI